MIAPSTVIAIALHKRDFDRVIRTLLRSRYAVDYDCVTQSRFASLHNVQWKPRLKTGFHYLRDNLELFKKA